MGFDWDEWFHSMIILDSASEGVTF